MELPICPFLDVKGTLQRKSQLVDPYATFTSGVIAGQKTRSSVSNTVEIFFCYFDTFMPIFGCQRYIANKRVNWLTPVGPSRVEHACCFPIKLEGPKNSLLISLKSIGTIQYFLLVNVCSFNQIVSFCLYASIYFFVYSFSVHSFLSCFLLLPIFFSYFLFCFFF